MMTKHKQSLAGITLIFSIVLLHVAAVQAASATFGQKILPLDCIFETVNDGTGTLHYVTPEACGQIISNTPLPGDSTSTPGEGQSGSGTDTSTQNTGVYNPDRTVFFVPTTSDTQDSTDNTFANTKQLPWRPITATVNTSNGEADKTSTATKLTTSKKVATAATAVGIVAIIALAVFIF